MKDVYVEPEVNMVVMEVEDALLVGVSGLGEGEPL